MERAHRVLAVVGKGDQRTLVPLAPRTIRAIDAALGGRADGPLLLSNSGGRLDRHDAARIAARHALDRHATYALAAFLAGDVALPHHEG